MTPQERIIVALDFARVNDAQKVFQQLTKKVNIFKLGPHLVYDPGFSDFVTKILENNELFVDLKNLDIPKTVSIAVSNLSLRQNIKMCTVHAEKNVMVDAVKAATGLKILAVPLLTSMAGQELTDFFNYHWQGCASDFVLERVKWAVNTGCHGTICSAQEVASIRANVPDDFLIIVPGTRSDNVSHHDHKRVGSPRKAILDGATHLVVGRQIILANDPAQEFDRIVKEIS